jgi:NitT/TauT family transport system substrate-binding protein
MMKRRSVLKLIGQGALAAPAVMTVARPGFAQIKEKEKITYAYLLDPAYDAVTWAMTNGKVTSDLITVEARGLAIPQLIQATSAKQYDVIMTAVIALPPAAARGLELRVLSTALQQSAAGEGAGVWVKSDSAIRSPKELKGKSLGSYGLRSTGYTQVRLALIHKYGLDAALEGGDLKQLEIQAPNLPGALAAGQIDAASLIHSQAFRALKSGEFRPIAETGRDNIEQFGMRFISALNVSYPERLARRPDAFREFNRMFRDSVRYALAHREEVFGAVGQQSNLPPEFFNWWFEKSSDVPGTFEESHAQAIMKLYELSREIGMIQSFPDIRTVVWEHALRG